MRRLLALVAVAGAVVLAAPVTGFRSASTAASGTRTAPAPTTSAVTAKRAPRTQPVKKPSTTPRPTLRSTAAPATTRSTVPAPSIGASRSSTEPLPSGRITVLAASSLRTAFVAAAGAVEARWPNSTVTVSFAGSPTVVTQVLNGAPADVVALADATNMARLETAKAVERPAVFARNRLAIVVRRTNPHGITQLADLTRPGLLVGLGGPSVPAGVYARQAFARAGLSVPEASQEPDVAAIVTKVALGELDAGIVYTTDVGIGADQVLRVEIPPGSNVEASFPIAVATEASNRPLARAFVAYLLAPEGQRLLGGFRFLAAS